MKIYKLILPLILILNACSVAPPVPPVPTIQAAVTSTGQQKVLSLLGGAKFQQVILDNLQPGWGVTIFSSRDTFGDGLPLVRELIARGKTPVIKLNLMWKDDHRFSRSDFGRIVAEGRRFNEIIERNPQVRFYILGATEHNLNQRDAQDLANQVLGAMPSSIQYINNPWTGAFIPTNDRILNEVHGSGARKPSIGGRYTFDCDGSSAVDINISSLKQRMPDAELFAYWHPSSNGRLKSGDTTPRSQRRSWVTAPIINSLVFLSTEKGQTDFHKNSRGTPRLWKSHSDRHNTPPEPRAYKPVVIVPEAVSYLELVAANGRSVAKSGAAQSYNDGRKRYYFTAYGYELANKARALSGNPVCTVKAGRTVIGHVNPAFRSGDFRE